MSYKKHSLFAENLRNDVNPTISLLSELINYVNQQQLANDIKKDLISKIVELKTIYSEDPSGFKMDHRTFIYLDAIKQTIPSSKELIHKIFRQAAPSDKTKSQSNDNYYGGDCFEENDVDFEVCN